MAQTELQNRFSPAKPIEADVLAELESMLRVHELSVEDLFLKWDSYCFKMEADVHTSLTLARIRNFKQSLQDDLEKVHREAQVKIESRKMAGGTPRAKAGAVGGDVFGMLDGLVPNTPGSGKLNRPSSLRKSESARKAINGGSPSNMSSQLKGVGGLAPSSFIDRTNAGETVEVLNEALAAAERPMAPYAESRIKLTAVSDQKKMGYKPMAMKLSEASEILDDRIDEFATLVQEHHSLDENAFGSAAAQGTNEIVAVGRIACDSPEGRLNAASLVLETSRRRGRGVRVPLKMDSIKSWSFFPGQIVALKGRNATGREFVVREIMEVPLLPNAATDAATLQTHIERLKGGPDAMDSDADPAPLNVMLASGPYTADDNLNYEPLKTLCDKAADSLADALILTGPFLDVDHPLLATGDFDLPEDSNYDPDTATMATVFKFLVAPALNRLVATNPSISLILVPSVRDLIDKHVSWPQEALSRKELGLAKQIRLVANPMTLFMNESILGISSQDVLFELQTEAVSHGATGDLKDRLCRYLLEQRHYYPIYPPSDRKKLHQTGTEEKTATGSVLDVGYLKLGEMGSVRPDILLTPSALPAFVRVVESVVIINPGYLSKRRAAGTYAQMTLYPPKVESDEPGHLQGHGVFSRARVEIVKI